MILGYCNICEKTKIWEPKPGGRMETTPFYCEIWLALSNDTIARHAICTHCMDSLTDVKIADLFTKIQKHWENEGGDKKFIYSLNVDAYHIDEGKVKEKYEKIKEDKRQKELENTKNKKDK